MRPNLRVILGVLAGVVTRLLFGRDDPFGIDEEEWRDPSRAPEVYGPTDINAQVANQRLAVAMNGEGTITVFRYPTPSYYDQIKYRTSYRDRPLLGAEPNEGSFLGIVLDSGEQTVFEPLRTWETSQEYATTATDTLVTRHTSDRWGLEAVVTDVMPPNLDGLVRNVEVRRTPESEIEDASLVAFENFNLVCSKSKKLPVQDWCLERLNTDTARYLSEHDAIAHRKQRVDSSTDTRTSIATLIAFEGRSTQHQVGGDAHEPTARETTKPSVPMDAFEDAEDGDLNGNTRFRGQTTGALLTPLSFSDGVATERVFITAASSTGNGPPSDTRARAAAKITSNSGRRSWVPAPSGSASTRP